MRKAGACGPPQRARQAGRYPRGLRLATAAVRAPGSRVGCFQASWCENSAQTPEVSPVDTEADSHTGLAIDPLSPTTYALVQPKAQSVRRRFTA